MAKVVDHAPSVHYLKDYQAPEFEVESVSLLIQIFSGETFVTSTLKLKAAHDQAKLELMGEQLELLEVWLNSDKLEPSQYELGQGTLCVANTPAEFELTTKVKICPEQNKALEGLYLAGTGSFEAGESMYVTQCEPEGFRRICYFLDRPDVMSVFTTRLEADKALPTLLANGNFVETGELPNNRHFATWHDPSKKPSYLFACVAANLECLKGTHTRPNGSEVSLEFYGSKADVAECSVALKALQDSMKWDEEVYGRVYDLDQYMVVATSVFNMGAMENKGLNIFNTACVLSSPQTTTDLRSLNVKSVVAHEYFHNWSGNRVTCRDWFQLCLKEGFTVFRDQSFTASLTSSANQRISDVQTLLAHQFPEDAGPLAHPPRPDHFAEINNFYTVTVYEKGAEIARMMHTLLGETKFRQGTDMYFERHDGEAVTVEDFVQALSDGSGVDLSAFMRWYTQAGTPTLSVQKTTNEQELTLDFKQSAPLIEGYPEPKPVPIPVDLAVFSESGELIHEQVFVLETEQARLTLEAPGGAVVSLLRGFSAPVTLDYNYSAAELALLVSAETNGFNQWFAAQTLYEQYLLESYQGKASDKLKRCVQSVALVFDTLAHQDPELLSKLLELPAEAQLATKFDTGFEPARLHEVREAALGELASMLEDQLMICTELGARSYEDTPKAAGKRALQNTCLDLLAKVKPQRAQAAAEFQLETATCMSERLGALKLLHETNHSSAKAKLSEFYLQFSERDLVIDTWFSLKASHPDNRIADFVALTEHERFDWHVPNRVRSVLGVLSRTPKLLYTQEGAQFLIDAVARLDQDNPIFASRLVQALSRWYTLAEPMKSQIKAQLEALLESARSKSVVETVANLLKRS